MKKSAKVIICTLALTIAASAAISAGYIVHVKKSQALIPEGFTVTAHTGCEGTDDNSLEAIVAGATAGADIVEFDLSFNSSGEPFLAHDDINGDSVTLKSAFETVASYDTLRVNVDCKSTDNLEAVVNCAREAGILDRIFYTGIKEKDVEAVKSFTPEIEYYLNVDADKSKKNDEEYIRSLVDKVKSLGAIGLNAKYTKVSQKMVEIFHEEGLKVSVWTVNEELAMHKVLTLGCDNITTRYPTKLKEIIKSK